MKTVRVSLFGLFLAVVAAACAPATSGNPGTGGTSSTGTAGTGNTCSSGQTPCGTECVNTATDPNNCGACGIPCSGGQTCQNSACACPSGLLACNGSCVASDAAHCGSCTNVCGANQLCSGGTCTSTCAGTTCGSACCTSSQMCTNNACVDVTGTGGTSGTAGTSGSAGTGGGTAGGRGGSSAGSGGSGGSTAGSGGSAGGSGGTAAAMPRLITSSQSGYWNTTTALTMPTSGTATITVNDGTMMKAFEGFGGAFNEAGWSVLMMLSQADRDRAMKLLFDGTDGANFVIGRIPMGASDYALVRHTYNETAGDNAMSNFSIARDMMANTGVIPYVKAAQAVRSNIRFWGSPWTPPTWMKTASGTVNGTSCANMGGNAYNGGCMQNTDANLMGLATYFTKFVQAYTAQGISVEMVAPQNEPNYSQGYPSALWEPATYTKFVRQFLGPAMAGLSPPVKVMLGTMSNGDNGAQSKDLMVVQNAMGDATARPMFKAIGLQWGMLDLYKMNASTFDMYNIPVWASEHKCGNYPWNPSGYPAYNMTAAPNNQAYAVESWGYIRDAIKAGVTAYNAWNMVLDTVGLGNDTVRDWRQNALLTVNTSSKTLNLTPTYHVFRHVSQYVQPAARVVATSGSTDVVAFKNTNGSVVAAMYNPNAAATYIVMIKNQRYQFSMPSQGWATLVVP